jgi:hypothetical protein
MEGIRTMEKKIESMILQSEERLEIEYRTKISSKDFYFLKSKLSLEKSPDYYYDLYKIYNSDSTYRSLDNGNKELKTMIMRFPRASFDINYSLSISIEKLLKDEYKNNTVLMCRRSIERYRYSSTDGFKVLLSKIITKSTKKKYISYEVELECETDKIILGEKMFLSFLLFTKFPFNMPVSPEKNMMKRIIYNYHPSTKADGERVFLIVSPKGIWHYNRKIDITLFSGNFSNNPLDKKEIIIDCEFLDKIYYTFDLPSLTEDNYSDRKKKLLEIFNNISPFIPSELKDLKKDIRNDGIIFTPQGKYSETTYKIKQIPTIEINFPLSDNVREYLESKQIFPFPQSHNENGIYEIDFHGRILRTRKDKSLPNPLGLIKKIASDDSWEKYQEIMNENGCQMMKYHHNKIKEKILDMINGSLLDIGGGNGEDVKKWIKKRCISEVFVVENNKNLIKELRRKISPSGKKKIKILDLIFDKDFHRKHKNKQKNMTMFFCLSKVVKEFRDIDDLTETINTIGIKNLYVIEMFEEDTIYKKCNRWSISSEGDERIITINGTKTRNTCIKKIYFNDFEKSMKKYGYNLSKKCNLPNPNMDCLSQEEYELNKLHSYVHFTKEDKL